MSDKCKCGYPLSRHEIRDGICNGFTPADDPAPEQAARGSEEFQKRAARFRAERDEAWAEFLEISSAAGYTIENNLANRSLFMGGYESGKERMNQRTTELEKRDRTCPHCGDQCDLIGD